MEGEDRLTAATATRRRELALPPTLSRFVSSDSPVRFVVGPVGSGKSSVCNTEILRRAARQRPGPDGVRESRFAIIRNTYRQLRDTTRKTFEQWIPQDERFGKWNETNFSFDMRFLHNNGTGKKHPLHVEVLFRALDSPADVKKLLSLELTGAYINEVREIPQHVFDVLQTRTSRYPAKTDGGASWSGIWADSNPWPAGHWAAKMFAKLGKADGYELFRQPGGREPGAENIEHLDKCWDSIVRDAEEDGPEEARKARREQSERLRAGEHEPLCRCYYQRLCVGKSKEWVKVYVDGLDASGDEGAIYGTWLSDLESRGGIAGFDHPLDGVYTNWDLGKSDSTAIWFWRIRQRRIRVGEEDDSTYRSVRTIDVIDHYENHHQGLAHYFGVLDRKGYRYVKHYLPHDARAETLATQQTVVERCIEHWGAEHVGITPQIGLDDGIDAGRWLLEQPGTRIHERCSDASSEMEYSGLDALRGYRYGWDEKNQCFSREPIHNWASHTADAWRYLAIVARREELATRPDELLGPAAVPTDESLTLDDLWAARDSARRWERD